MKLLIITRGVDLNDDLLGFFNGWIKEFAKNFERVFVITLAKGDYDLPDNVEIFSLGKEKGDFKLIQALRYFKLLIKYVPRCDGIFAHISPIFAISVWPFKKLFRKRLVFWYLHNLSSLKVRFSFWLSDFVVTASKESLGIRSAKIIELGHGINAEIFRTTRNWLWPPEHIVQILSVGRISPIKDYETLLRAGRLLKDKNIKFKIKIVGRPIMSGDEAYLNKLIKKTKELRLEELVEFVGFLPYRLVAQEYKTADIVVGMTPKGGIDKSLLEAMASGALILTSNEAMARYLGAYSKELIFNHGDSADFAGKLAHMISWPVQNKTEASIFFSGSVERFHNLKNLIEKISKLYE